MQTKLNLAEMEGGDVWGRMESQAAAPSPVRGVGAGTGGLDLLLEQVYYFLPVRII